MKSDFSEIFSDFVSLIYPRYCLACKDGLVKGEDMICGRCIHDLPRTNYHLELKNPIFNKLYGRLPLRFASAFLFFQKESRVQHLLHELKYNNHPEIGSLLGKVYGEELRLNGLQPHIDCIIPIPLHLVKKRRRGYNQSDEFAKGLSEILGTPCVLEGVERVIKTDTQTRKSRLRRWENVKDVFLVSDRKIIEGKRVLLVDDVITTGATLEACGQALVNSGCMELSVAGIAYAKA